MKLSIKALLPLAILLSGSVNCSAVSPPPANLNERNELKTTIADTMYFEESLVMALEHPSMMIDPAAPNKMMNFDKWVKYLHDDDEKEKEAREKRIAGDAAYMFYYLDLKEEEINTIRDYLDKDPKIKDFSRLSDATLQKKIQDQFKIKKKYLETILEQLPIIKKYMNPSLTDEFDNKIRSHINAFIADSLMFDYKRFNFSALHPAIEGIKGALEVPRKAKHGAEAAVKALADSTKYDIVAKNPKLDKLYIKRKKVEDPNPKEKTQAELEDEKKAEEKRKREINLIVVALESANRSTSNPEVLRYTLIGSLLLMTALIAHSAITAKPAEDEETEGDEECGEAN